ncbi:MAG: hypothetical protein A3H98_03515 [Bacteroidetes bacterium RIFCSPLOWO2_02_FULL_36_8]|nr:MAG: hypothetical protein A3H98_03515 [Bacteroidetes bacterium RIFCSPLOWO2_02_FULL_36_8]OFY69510.1 MAG: hypothetical protein A3G23_10760 [Bacteroidetes bacterium RIFCSPLOWO2_12_FULL_37_12]
MKKTLYLILFTGHLSLLNAQIQIHESCGFDNYLRQNNISVEKFERTVQNYLRQNKSQRNSAMPQSLKIIPVVVHVVHNGGTENISDAQIQSQMDALNEDYRKMPGTAGDGAGADTEIEFRLAKKDPQGRCTNGIVRIKSTLTSHQNYQRADLAKLSSWDATRYLNIYVVKTISGGTAGYASFPGGPTDQDGIVVMHTYFGRTGTASSSLGRTPTHEAGHWLGVYHTFQNGCGTDTCTEGDYVCDTPPAANPNYFCPVINSCSNDFPDVKDQIENYMDYSDDNCKNMFTSGQKERMYATLNTERITVWQLSNLIATGCDSGYVSAPCNAVADFTSNAKNICVGNSVSFVNKSLNNCTTFQWNFPGGNPETSTQLNPVIKYDSTGNYEVSLKATNSNGTDSVTIENYITVSIPPTGRPVPFIENFEEVVFPPQGIILENPDNGITWELDTVAVKFSGYGSAKINNLININYGQADALVFPNMDLTTFTETPIMTFRWAYARSDANYSDELMVLISTDCGATFKQIFYRTGSQLTTGTTQTTPYIPDSSTVWKFAKIQLTPYAFSKNAILKIVNVTDGGNNLYIDSINIGKYPITSRNNFSNENSVLIYPNPFTGNTVVHFTGNFKEKTLVRIFDIFGKEVYYFYFQIASNVFIPERNFKKGIYIMKIFDNNAVIVKKFIVQ